MKALRLTKAEHSLIWSFVQDHPGKTAAGLRAKLEKAERQDTVNVAVKPIEDALVAAARGKVVPLVSGHARASVQATRAGATVEDAKVVGEWMARQGWLRGPQTLLDVLNKWPQWLSKAKASAPPPSLQPGFGNADTGSSTEGESSRPAGGRPEPGFGRRA